MEILIRQAYCEMEHRNSFGEETRKLLERCSKYPNFVIASGCDIPPMTPFENMDVFFETIEEFYKIERIEKSPHIAKKCGLFSCKSGVTPE